MLSFSPFASPYIWRFWCVGAGFSAFLSTSHLPLDEDLFSQLDGFSWAYAHFWSLFSQQHVAFSLAFLRFGTIFIFITSAEGEHFLVFRLFDNVYSELLAFRHILPFIFTVSKVLLACYAHFLVYPTDFFLLSYSSRYFHFWNHFLNVLYFFFSVLCLFYFGHSN